MGGSYSENVKFINRDKMKAKEETKWTLFWDMHSGGGTKEEPYEKIYIEAPEEEAKVIFYNRFGHNPERVSCTCCGEDYSIIESETLEQASGYHRNCAWDKETKSYVNKPNVSITVEEYSKQKDVLIIPKSEIKDNERIGYVPREGY